MSTETETGPDEAQASAAVKRAPDAEARAAHQGANLEWAVAPPVYEPHRVGLPPIGPYVREIWNRREFAFELSRMHLRAQHFETAFGQLWLLLHPMLVAMVYFVLVDILPHGHRPPHFFAHLVAGIFA